ncbi:MAG: adenosylcobinamide amidohydrolase [Chloroflexi bacterium]|nr:adenosylcobinamide amidohydrolase [Chloroflexota bacterium]
MLSLFPQITIGRDDELLLIRSIRPLHILSSAVVGGGLTRARVILNRHVHKHYSHPDPAADLLAFARGRGVDEPFVGMMTAAYLERARVAEEAHEEVRVAAIATVGLSHPTAAGLTPPFTTTPSTINIILLIDARLTPAALVNAVITATEAKAAALFAQGVRSDAGHPATGTATDVVAVACTGRGPALAYAGPVTPGVGSSAAWCARLWVGESA